MAENRRPRADYYGDDQPFCPTLTVYERTEQEIDTGLIMPDGTKIVRRQPMGPIGFDIKRFG